MRKQVNATAAWWATGDMPVRTTSQLAFLIDGRMTMLEMCICFLRARHTISITAFGFSPELLMVRGKYTCAGAPDSEEQQTLLRWLRKKGLSENDLAFWQSSAELSVTNVLRYVVGKGVDVRVLLWDTYTLPFHPGPKDIQKALTELGVCCVLDDSHKGLLNHPLEAHHQKTAIVDSQFAFVGGIDVMVNSNGEFDRWDTKGHPYHTDLRLDKNGNMPHSWHDTHVFFEGDAVADVERNFCQRWNTVLELHKADPALRITPPASEQKTVPTLPYRLTKGTTFAPIQVIRTIPKGTYAFSSEEGIATILDAYQRAFAQARQHIYIENQYLWQRTFLGFENPTLGLPHDDMKGLLQALAEALARGVSVTLVLPDNPNVGREFTDEGINELWKLAPQAREAGTLQIYTLGSAMQQDAQTYYRSIYVHAKTTIVDDTWITLGSANLNNRGMRDDTELNVAIVHPGLAQRLRMLLMAEHLGLYDEDMLFQMLDTRGKLPWTETQKKVARLKNQPSAWRRLNRVPLAAAQAVPEPETHQEDQEDLDSSWAALTAQLGNPLKSTALFARQARENLLAVRTGQPISGHLLPYIPHNLAAEYEVEVHPTNGWLDILPQPERKLEAVN